MLSESDMMRRKHIAGLFGAIALLVTLVGCGKKDAAQPKAEEDVAAKKMLQGVWTNEDEGDVAFMVKGDTIFYPDSTSQPTYFLIMADTLTLKGANEVKYPIVKQAAHIFQFKNQNGDVVKLVKSDDKSLLEDFEHPAPVALNQNQLIKRDTVVTQGDKRYHCYVQVNPTTYKVFKTSYNDEGVEVDNVYYDNIIHISVYNGSASVFSHDYRKSDFAKDVPDSFLRQAVLSDMLFEEVSDKGIIYTAVLAIPDSSMSYQIQVTIPAK